MKTPCADCGHEADRCFSQRHDGIRLFWSESVRCRNCGNAIEMDDDGFPPAEVREQLLADDGRYALLVIEDSTRRLHVGKILHCDLDTTLEEVRRMKDRMPGRVYTGTRVEMDWLSNRLGGFGYSASLERVANDPGSASIDLSLRLRPSRPQNYG